MMNHTSSACWVLDKRSLKSLAPENLEKQRITAWGEI